MLLFTVIEEAIFIDRSGFFSALLFWFFQFFYNVLPVLLLIFIAVILYKIYQVLRTQINDDDHL
ncbi:MAG: hypothetical protein JJU16_01465 [Alkalibacterium sp.]|nr:hypothetical protein [Alkalibacterium sp.]